MSTLPDTAAAWRCAVASQARGETVAGTATHVRTWVLLEHPGPWGVDALRDARLPEGLGEALKQRARDLRAKVLLVRRHGSRTYAEDGVRVFAAVADPVAARLESGLLGDPRELLDLDLDGFRHGGTTGLPAYDGDLFCVCTNGRHDACCAETGRPIAAALSAAHPAQTWEISHIGGDRFAGNVVVLPHGLYYGRLDPDAALGVARAHLAGDLVLDHLRGRSTSPSAAQAAEIALRRELGVVGLADVVLRSVSTEADGEDRVTRAVLDARGTAYAVTVRTTRSAGPAERLTCRARRPGLAPVHDVVAIEPA